MQKQRLVAFGCILVLFSLPALAQSRVSEWRQEYIWITKSDPTPWDAVEDPVSVSILQVFNLPDDGGKRGDKSLEMLKRFPKLKTLVLACPRMGDQELTHVAKLKDLECLIIYDGEISDKGILELKSLAKLKTVGFHRINVTDEGVQQLKLVLSDTYFERGSFGKNGQLFDANGCMRWRYLGYHLSGRRPEPK